MKARRITAAAAALTLAAAMVHTQAVFASSHEGFTEIDLDTGADRSGDIISVNVPINIEGKQLRLVATGLREDNKDAFIKAVEDNYRTDESTPLYIHDSAFVDAEKFDLESPLYDSNLCWAASASNVLWLTGWAQNYSDPFKSRNFGSEDDVFDFFRSGFINKGGETEKGFDWFFDGLFFISGAGSHTFPVNQKAPEPGVDKDFVVSQVYEVYDLKDDPSAVSNLLDLDKESENARGFGLSIGGCSDDYIGMACHAVTAGGIIYDPEETDPASRYKAMLIIDSDNDANAEFELDPTQSPDTEEILGCKSARPNSYTLYNLNYKTLGDGHNVWELLNYSDDPDEPYVIYGMIGMPLYDEELIAENTETEGSKKQYENVDLVIDYMFTTNSTEPQMIPFKERVEEDSSKWFGQSEAINLNVFIANQSGTDLNSDYPGGNMLTFEWTVTNKADGSVVYSGTEKHEADIFTNAEVSYLLKLNTKDGIVEKWEPGNYTVTLRINPDKAISESYYLNNKEATFDFNILADAPAESSIYESESESSSEVQTEVSSDSSRETASVSKKDADTKSSPAANTAASSNPSTGAAAGTLALAALGAAAVIVSKKNK